MTMRLLSVTALGARLFQLLILISLAHFTNAETRTTTTTLFSTTAITTETVTITTHGQVLAELTTATSIEQLPRPTETMTWGSGNGNYSRTALKEQALNSTNFFRNQYEAKALTWDASLAQYGQRHAEKCIWEHSGGPHGENMAEGFGSPTLAIDAWAGEESEYNWAAADFSESTGHFTQLVWQNTTRFGCGAAHCNGGGGNAAFGWFMVCEYDPPGNVIGQFKYNVKKAGMTSGGKLPLGRAGRLAGSSRLLVALVAASSLAAACL